MIYDFFLPCFALILGAGGVQCSAVQCSAEQSRAEDTPVRPFSFGLLWFAFLLLAFPSSPFAPPHSGSQPRPRARRLFLFFPVRLSLPFASNE